MSSGDLLLAAGIVARPPARRAHYNTRNPDGRTPSARTGHTRTTADACLVRCGDGGPDDCLRGDPRIDDATVPLACGRRCGALPRSCGAHPDSGAATRHRARARTVCSRDDGRRGQPGGTWRCRGGSGRDVRARGQRSRTHPGHDCRQRGTAGGMAAAVPGTVSADRSPGSCERQTGPREIGSCRGHRSGSPTRTAGRCVHLGLVIQVVVFTSAAVVLFLIRSDDVSAGLAVLALALGAVGSGGPLLGAESAVPLARILTVFAWVARPLAFPIIGLAILYFPRKSALAQRYRWLHGVPFLIASPMIASSVGTGAVLVGARCRTTDRASGTLPPGRVSRIVCRGPRPESAGRGRGYPSLPRQSGRQRAAARSAWPCTPACRA